MTDFNPSADLLASLPLLVLVVTGLVLMLADAFKAHNLLPVLTAGGLLATIAVAVPGGVAAAEQTLHFSGAIYFGGLSGLLTVFICVVGLLALVFYPSYFYRSGRDVHEVYALSVFAIAGMVMLATANDLLVVFVGLEIMSVALYILAGLFARQNESNESGLKYFLLGAFASAFLLYGISLLYGLSGTAGEPTTKLHLLATRVDVLAETPLFFIAAGLILVGFLFKVAAFPFHSWTPDVYTGAPTPLAGFMATGGKLAAFTAFAFFMMKAVPAGSEKIATILGAFALLSMLYGNIVAVQQSNIKRILAYSSIAHTGYMMLGLISGAAGAQAVIFYMVTYSLMTIGAFGIISMVENGEKTTDLSRWKGLGMRSPWIGIVMSAFLFSMAGMPPLAGFMGKYFVFSAAVAQGHYYLATVGILTSVIGAYYYLRIIVVMFFQKPEAHEEAWQAVPAHTPAPMATALVLVVALIVLGILPTLVSDPLAAFFNAATSVAMK